MNIDDALTQRIQTLHGRFEKQAGRPISRGELAAIEEGLRRPPQESEFVSAADTLRNIYGTKWPDIKSRATRYRQQNSDLSQKYFLGTFNPTDLTRFLPIEDRHSWGYNSMTYSPSEKQVSPRVIQAPVKWINRQGISGDALTERLMWGEELGHARQDYPIQWERIPTLSERVDRWRAKERQHPYPPSPVPPMDPVSRSLWGVSMESDINRGLRHMWDLPEFPRKVAQIRQLYHMITPDAQIIETPKDFLKAWEDVYQKVQSNPELKKDLPASTFPLLHTHPRDLPEETVDAILRLGPGVVEAPEDRRPSHG